MVITGSSVFILKLRTISQKWSTYMHRKNQIPFRDFIYSFLRGGVFKQFQVHQRSAQKYRNFGRSIVHLLLLQRDKSFSSKKNVIMYLYYSFVIYTCCNPRKKLLHSWMCYIYVLHFTSPKNHATQCINQMMTNAYMWLLSRWAQY